MCFAPQQRTLFRHLNFQKCSEPGVLCTFWPGNVLRARTACTFQHLNFQSAPNLVCFAHFDLEMCFAPQRRTLFHHLNFQKCSQHGVFCTFWLGNVLHATLACNFLSLIRPDGSALVALASLLFDPPETQTQIIGKTQCFATFLPFRARASSFLWLFLWPFLFSDLLSSSLLFSSPTSAFPSVHAILSEAWLFYFLRLMNTFPFEVDSPWLNHPNAENQGPFVCLKIGCLQRFYSWCDYHPPDLMVMISGPISNRP